MTELRGSRWVAGPGWEAAVGRRRVGPLGWGAGHDDPSGLYGMPVGVNGHIRRGPADPAYRYGQPHGVVKPGGEAHSHLLDPADETVLLCAALGLHQPPAEAR